MQGEALSAHQLGLGSVRWLCGVVWWLPARAGAVRMVRAKHKKRRHELLPRSHRLFFGYLVGETGFEPAAPCTPYRCATKLRHSPTVLARSIYYRFPCDVKGFRTPPVVVRGTPSSEIRFQSGWGFGNPHPERTSTNAAC